jgi:hypothetical protein
MILLIFSAGVSLITGSLIPFGITLVIVAIYEAFI